MDVALLIARLIIGLGMAAHGAQKLFGAFGGPGLGGIGGFVASLGFRPAPLFALLLGLGEFGGGMLTALGFLGPVGPALIILVMTTTIGAVHWGHAFFASGNGSELPLVFSAGALALAFAGPGAWSLDALLGLESLWAPRVAWIAIAAALVIAAVNLVLRRPPKGAPSAA